MVYSLLSMLGTHDKDDMSRTLLAMSSSQDSCIAMRQSGCLPLLIQLLHGNDKDSVLLGNSRGSKEARARASAALHNIIHSQPDDKRGRREIRVLHLLEQIRAYCETCWEWQEIHERGVDQDKNPSECSRPSHYDCLMHYQKQNTRCSWTTESLLVALVRARTFALVCLIFPLFILPFYVYSLFFVSKNDLCIIIIAVFCHDYVLSYNFPWL